MSAILSANIAIFPKKQKNSVLFLRKKSYFREKKSAEALS